MSSATESPPEPAAALDRRIRSALEEDLGDGDWTTRWTVDSRSRSRATIVAKQALVLAGAEVAKRVFQIVDPTLGVELVADDGDAVEASAELLRIEGSTRAILTAERTALNFMGKLSGIATLSRRFVDEVRGTDARITDTRKTTPGWRRLEKWATRLGGAVNHRMGLHDMVLVKDNHIAAAGGVRAAVARVRDRNDRGLPVEVEITRPVQVAELRELGVDRILLDNMDNDELAAVVREVSRWPDPRPELEASGNMTLERVRSVAETGVDWISVGALTHSAGTADLSLRLLEPPRSGSETSPAGGP